MIISGIDIRTGKLQKVRLESVAQNETKCIAVPKDNLSEIISEIVVDERFVSSNLMNTELDVLDQFNALSSLAM
jgi:hypothetical protein